VIVALKYKIMTIENRVEATAKNIEGKIQEAVSEVTGNQKDKLEGQAKQDEASASLVTVFAKSFLPTESSQRYVCWFFFALPVKVCLADR
jgi:uncharacterized protein YjbJ (UPF0337 family)